MTLISAQTLPAVVQSLGLNLESFRSRITLSRKHEEADERVHALPDGRRLVVDIRHQRHLLMLQLEAGDGTVLRELGFRETPASESALGHAEFRLFKSVHEAGRHIHLQANYASDKERELSLAAYVIDPFPKILSQLTISFNIRSKSDAPPLVLAMHRSDPADPFLRWPENLPVVTTVEARALQVSHDRNLAVPFFRELLPDLPANAVGLIFHHPEQNGAHGLETAADALLAGGQVYVQAQILKAGGGVETPSELQWARFGLKDFI